MRSYLKKISVLALAAAANAELIKRDPYWIKMSDIIQQVRPDFYYGVSTQRNFFNNPKYKDVISTYNLQVAGNECKFYTIQSSETENFKPCDESIEFAKKYDAKFRGHTLFWPAYSSEWFKTYSDDIEETKEYILDYVTRVLDHYKDEEDIIYWDVINEAVLDDSTEDNIKFRTGSDTSNEFKGWDTYTEDLFTLAREHTNPNVKLIYNDYNAENNNGNYQGKTGAVFNYIKSMREKDIPIDGVGLQMHISCNYYPNYDQLTELIDKYAEIGVEVHITEIDVSMEKCKTHDQQRELYMDVFKACFDNENCKVFTVWGAYDSESWKGAENEPLPFDEKMYPKDIYFDMLEYVLDKLPEDATYPTPTATKPVDEEPTEAAEDENITYLIEPGTFMIDPQWQSWSWGNEEVTIDDNGNVATTLIEEEYGAFSLHYSSKFNGGKLHVEMMIDKSAPVAIVAHTVKGEDFVEIDRIEDVSTEDFQAFDFEIPAVEGDSYDRISLQDAWGKAITITVHEMYLIPNAESSSSTSTKTSSSAGSNRYDIIKEGDFMLVGNWQNWSWGVEDSEFDEDGNLVSYITAGTYGGVSFKRSDSVIFGAGTLHFKAKVNDTDAQIQILFHTIDDEYVNVGSVKEVSDEEMVEYTIEVDEPTGELYDRITIQDVANNGLTLYLNDVYFLAAEITEESTDVAEVEEPTENEETTEEPEEPEDELPAEALEGYCILKDGEVDPDWQNWSWGVESAEVVSNGLANVLTAGEWGGISFKRGDDLLLGAGTLYFKAKADTKGASLQVVVHNTAADEYYNQGTIKDISTTKMTLYSMEIESPSSPSTMYDRVTIQDIYNEGVTITIDDVYYVAKETEQDLEEATQADLEEPTEVEPVKEPVEEVDGDRYDILIGGEVDPEWQNWSWGVESAEVDEDGNLANVVTAGEWGGISFKRGDSTLFGAGTLYFKAKADNANAVIQIVAHSTAADEYYNMETIKDLSTTKMTEYAVTIKEPESEKYDRFTIQDVYNKGVIIYLNDVYFVADPSTEVEEPTVVEVEEPTEAEPEEDEPIVEGDNVYYILKKGEVDPEWENWSWGVESAELDKNGNLANVLTAGEWAGISFKRVDSKLFTTGTLHFKAKADNSKAIIQVVAHSTTDDDDYQIMDKVTDFSTTKMTEYAIQIKEPKGEKYDRFTLQDVYNKGVTVYLSDIYFVADEEEEEVEDPNCWAAEFGFKCCKTTTRVVLEDEKGSWGVEKDFWCGIIEDKNDTCWSTRLGYPCCKENNVLYAIDEQGSWGYEDNQWCGIAKADDSCEFSALGYECCPDAEVVQEDEHKWGFVEGKWCGVAF